MWSRFGAFEWTMVAVVVLGLLRQLSLSASTYKVRACVAVLTSQRDDHAAAISCCWSASGSCCIISKSSPCDRGQLEPCRRKNTKNIWRRSATIPTGDGAPKGEALK